MLEHAIEFMNGNLEQAIEFNPIIPAIPFVDDWIPNENQIYFKSAKDIIVLPLSVMFGINDLNFDIFKMSSKRCYNSEKVRDHTTHYLNYFINYFDIDKQLLIIYRTIKYFIDYVPYYNMEMFKRDIQNYILSPYILWRADLMNEYNFNINLTCKSKIKDALIYNNKHGKLLMKLSLLFNLTIPLMSHFMSSNNCVTVDDFILEIYDLILERFEDEVDIYSKIYETAFTTSGRSQNTHSGLWLKQDIRSRNVTTHTIECVSNILLNIMPKYEYNQNGVIYNYQSLLKSNKYKVEDISYEYAFFSMSSSKRDEDHQSEFDKFESYQIKKDESLYLQNQMNARTTMTEIDLLFGPFSTEEIKFYKSNIGKINDFQKELIFNMFYKYFGDTDSIKDNNADAQFKLMIAAKRILIDSGLKIMPYIISSRIDKMVRRKNINKKEYNKILASPIYQHIKDKYKSEKILDYIMNLIATILSSKFTIIDFEDETIHNTQNEIEPAILCEEVLLFVAQI